MKKFFKIVGIAFASLFVLGIIAAVFGSNDNGPGTKSEPAQVAEKSAASTQPAAKSEPAAAPAPKKEEPKSNVFAYGTEVPFESGLNMKVLGVKETAERNQFEDPTKHVMVISLEVTNTTGAEITLTSNDLNVQDKDGFQGKTYPGGDQMVTVAPNGKARAEFQYGVDGDGPYKVLAGVATWQ